MVDSKVEEAAREIAQLIESREPVRFNIKGQVYTLVESEDTVFEDGAETFGRIDFDEHLLIRSCRLDGRAAVQAAMALMFGAWRKESGQPPLHYQDMLDHAAMHERFMFDLGFGVLLSYRINLAIREGEIRPAKKRIWCAQLRPAKWPAVVAACIALVFGVYQSLNWFGSPQQPQHASPALGGSIDRPVGDWPGLNGQPEPNALPISDSFGPVVLHPDGGRYFYCSRESSEWVIKEMSSNGNVSVVYALGSMARWLDMSPTGDYLAAIDINHNIHLAPTSAGAESHHIDASAHEPIYVASIGETKVVWLDRNGSAVLADALTGSKTPLGDLAYNFVCTSTRVPGLIALTPTPAGVETRIAQVFTSGRRLPLQPMLTGNQRIVSIDASPSLSTIALGLSGGGVVIYNKSGDSFNEIRADLPGNNYGIALSVEPGGAHVAVMTDALYLLDATDGAVLGAVRQPEHLDGIIFDAQWSDSGSIEVSTRKGITVWMQKDSQ